MRTARQLPLPWPREARKKPRQYKARNKQLALLEIKQWKELLKPARNAQAT